MHSVSCRLYINLGLIGFAVGLIEFRKKNQAQSTAPKMKDVARRRLSLEVSRRNCRTPKRLHSRITDAQFSCGIGGLPSGYKPRLLGLHIGLALKGYCTLHTPNSYILATISGPYRREVEAVRFH